MSSNLMDTEPGGEQTQYEGEHTHVQPHKKSGGQLGTPSTTVDPSKTDEAIAQSQKKGEQTASNIRYGQGISEGGVGGHTTGQSGEARKEGYGRVEDQTAEVDADEQRRAAGYGGQKDMDREIGA